MDLDNSESQGRNVGSSPGFDYHSVTFSEFAPEVEAKFAISLVRLVRLVRLQACLRSRRHGSISGDL